MVRTTNVLASASKTSRAPREFLEGIGEVFAVFDEQTQDSGNVSYGWQNGGHRYFIKTAGAPEAKAFLDHADRVCWLENAIKIARSVEHQALPNLVNVIRSTHGPMLVYKWADGELVGVRAAARDDPASSYRRFRSLPTAFLLAALDIVFDCHRAICAGGWVANDFYDGAMIYNFDAHTMTLVDLDLYRAGTFTNDMGRMFGSTRFMAPEELRLGAVIDERTTVFNMGRCLLEFVDSRLKQLPSISAVAQRACEVSPEDRFDTYEDFFTAWRGVYGQSRTERIDDSM